MLFFSLSYYLSAVCFLWMIFTSTNIPSKKSSAQEGVRVNSVLTRNDCIKSYIWLFKEIILQELDAFQTKIQGSLTKLCI